jgi:CRISPR-associated protein Cas1
MGKVKHVKLALDSFGSFLGRDKGCLLVRDGEGNKKRFPLFDNEIGEIQIRSGNTVSSGALATCGFWNIDVLILTGRGHPIAILKSLYDDSHVETRISQYRALENGKASEIAKKLVLGKIEGQNQVLKKFGLRRIDFSVIQTIKNLNVEDHETLRRRLMGIEGKCSERYFDQIFRLFNESVRPSCRKKFKANDGLNNLFNLAYRVLSWKVHIALIKAKLEPYLGFLHGVQFGKPSLVCDFIELYRYLIDDFLVEYARKLKPKHFVIKAEDFSRKRKGKRQYLNEKMTNEFIKKLNAYFESEVEVPRIRVGKRQELETLINEEAMLLAKFLRDEREEWIPRIAIPTTKG